MKKNIILILFLAVHLKSVSCLAEQLPLFQPNQELSAFEYQKFVDHTETRLPNFKKYFKIYSERYQIPWTLIAAVAYQESKWNEEATSHTGVKGLMQLTSKTAKHLGVDDREDPYESIRGGAFYLKYLYDKTPLKLNNSQRWALALSAYNIGWGHLRDAHHLALELNKDPYNWTEFKTILPKLENPKYYSKLTYGFARGKETVVFVDKVFNYYNLLNATFSSQSKIAKLDYNSVEFFKILFDRH